MISAPSRRQRSSGNRRALAFGFLLCLLLAGGACDTKKKVLRSPSRPEIGVIGVKPGRTEKKKDGESLSYAAKRAEAMKNSIALVLPFQLDKVKTAEISKKDVDRSTLALDFYQGFQLGLDQLSDEGKSFALRVIDSRDDEARNTVLAKSNEVASAAIIVGPVYPKEINAFGANLADRNVLQINPLAARAGDFHLPNLVSLTPPISVHTAAIATKVAKDCDPQDVVIIYNAANSDSQQFLHGFSAALVRVKPGIRIRQVDNIEQMNEAFVPKGKNLLVVPTTDKFQLRILLNNLRNKRDEGSYTFRLYGHPLWDQIDFGGYPGFPDYSPVISTESHLNPNDAKAKEFQELYYSLYGVDPSVRSYKGYDAAHYFGTLLAKYGKRHAQNLVNERFEGVFSSYKFAHSEASGYVNQAVSYKVYQGSAFRLLKLNVWKP